MIPRISRPVTLILLGLAAVLLVLAALNVLSGKRAAVEAKLGRSQADAAVQSGADAVNAVGKAGEREDELDRRVNDAQAKIDAAPDAGAADAAGRDGLCAIHHSFCPEPVRDAAPK